MRPRLLHGLVLGIATGWLCASSPARGDGPPGEAERRAVAFLAREVPAWSRENHCFSCHNNGDAARALLAATASAEPPNESTLADTLGWLARPEQWDSNAVDPAISDKVLARLQFATALAVAVERGKLRDRAALVRAAERVANDQAADGFWPIGADGALGTPATYGRSLGTALARRTLAAAEAERFARPVARAERWLRERPVENVLDAAAALIGLSPEEPKNQDALRRSFELLRKAQTDRGGWGPFLRSPPEPFDTALAVLALDHWPEKTDAQPFMMRGRAFLVSIQNEDGSWTETTRPPGGESYAQRISTTGWATLALLATAKQKP